MGEVRDLRCREHLQDRDGKESTYMKMKLLGFKDREFEEGVNSWLTANPNIELRHATAFPLSEGWWQLMIFFDERPAPQKEWSPVELRSTNPV